MTHDDDMREIEDAVDTMILHQRKESREGRGIDLGNRDRLLALIRAKLPAADAEHEAKVEAWLDRAHFVNGNYLVSGADIDEALRLMRARPAATVEPHSFTGTDRTYADLVAREKAAGELLRAAKAVIGQLSEKQDYDDMRAAIEAFERAGVKP